MILSRNDIEAISIGVLNDFNSIFWKKSKIPYCSPQVTPIDQFATEYLGLNITFYPLCHDGSFCGLTAYADTEYVLELNGSKYILPLKKNQIVLDRSFLDPKRIRTLCGKRRFTLAHECAHQILFQLEADGMKHACRKLYSERRLYSKREFKSKLDWNEWQADSLAAALLMPSQELSVAMSMYSSNHYVKSFEGKFDEVDSQLINRLCQIFGVSKSAMCLRLKHLGMLKELPLSNFFYSKGGS